MKELSLQELKQIEFDLLQMFDAFAKENDIKYYLSHGTLLGAIRYKGFIPWDDDIDLLIPRDDYNRMLDLFKDTERYKIFAYEKDPDFPMPVGKLCDMTTLKNETNVINKYNLGVDIDLFPLDAWDDDIEKAKKEVRYLRRNMFLLGIARLKKVVSRSPLKFVARWLLTIFCKMFGSRYFVEKIVKVSNNPPKADSKYLGCKAWCVYKERGIIPAKVFEEIEYIDFEGKKFPAPKDWDTYLTCIYGDYLPEPPKDKQKTHHGFVAYKL